MSIQNSKFKIQNFSSKVKIFITFGFLLSFLIFAFCALSFIPSVFAQQNTISVTPQIVRLDLATDAPEAEFTYKNATKAPLELTLSIQDFKELEESGIPDLLNEKEAENYKYGLSSWASLSTNIILVNPQEEKTIKVLIDKTHLTLGGHYASVLAEIKQKSDGKNVKLKAILSSLLFVRAQSGFEREEGKIIAFRKISDGFEFPDKFSVRLQNTGNVDITPFGTIEVFDFLGRNVAKGIVNEGSLSTLPESIRRYEIPVNLLSKFLPIGFYNAKASIHFGKNNIKTSSEISFFSQGNADIKLIALIAIGITASIFIVVKALRKKK